MKKKIIRKPNIKKSLVSFELIFKAEKKFLRSVIEFNFSGNLINSMMGINEAKLISSKSTPIK